MSQENHMLRGVHTDLLLPSCPCVATLPLPHPRCSLQGEAQTVDAFRGDPYGCSDALTGKRAQRDPFSTGGLTPERCPAMGDLLDYCGPEFYPGELPWAEEKLVAEELGEALEAAANSHAQQRR